MLPVRNNVLLNSAKRPIETVFLVIVFVVIIYYTIHTSLLKGDIIQTSSTLRSHSDLKLHSFKEYDPSLPVSINQQERKKNTRNNNQNDRFILLKNLVISSLDTNMGLLNKEALVDIHVYLMHIYDTQIETNNVAYKISDICLKHSDLSNYSHNGILGSFSLNVFNVWNNSVETLQRDPDIIDTFNKKINNIHHLYYYNHHDNSNDLDALIRQIELKHEQGMIIKDAYSLVFPLIIDTHRISTINNKDDETTIQLIMNKIETTIKNNLKDRKIEFNNNNNIKPKTTKPLRNKYNSNPTAKDDYSIYLIIKAILKFMSKIHTIIIDYKKASLMEGVMYLIGYILMYKTFIDLIVKMHKNKSKTSMALLTLIQGVFAFILALFIFFVLDKKVDVVVFTRGIPFVVYIVGFNKHIRVFHRILRIYNSTNNNKQIEKCVCKGFTELGSRLMKEYIAQIALLIISYLVAKNYYYSNSVSQFCLLSLMIVLFDCILLFTLYPAFVALKLHVLKKKQYEQQLLISSTNSNNDLDVPANYRNIAYTAFSEDSNTNNNQVVSVKYSVVHRVKVLATIGAIVIQIMSFKLNNKQKVMEESYNYYKEYNSIVKIINKINNNRFVFKVTKPINMVYRSNSSKDAMGTEFLNNNNMIYLKVALFAICVCSIILLVFKIYRKINPTNTSSKNTLSLQTDIKNYKDHCIDNDKCSIFNKSKNDCIDCENNDLMEDKDILDKLDKGEIQAYNLDKMLKCNSTQAIRIRRKYLNMKQHANITEQIPFMHYTDYSLASQQCCENIIGYLPVPLGVTSPLKIDGMLYTIPMATTEGCLIASTSRGCKAITQSDRGVNTVVTKDGMCRGPVLEFESAIEGFKFKVWMESSEGSKKIEQKFNETTRFGKLKEVKIRLAGKLVFVRFVAFTGDAMGMNMVSKGVENCLEYILQKYKGSRVVSISGNYCTDKKPSAINWIEGRGKSVIAETIIKEDIIKKVLKTTAKDLVKLNIAKNLIGSSMAGSIGGNNAHAANIVTAIYIACGQDPAQNVESSSCLTVMELCNNHQDLYISCTMPCIEVGTVGGGTVLSAQAECLNMLGVKGPNKQNPGENAARLARIVAAAVLAGELSLCAALASGHLVKSHMEHNRANKDNK